MKMHGRRKSIKEDYIVRPATCWPLAASGKLRDPLPRRAAEAKARAEQDKQTGYPGVELNAASFGPEGSATSFEAVQYMSHQCDPQRNKDLITQSRMQLLIQLSI